MTTTAPIDAEEIFEGLRVNSYLSIRLLGYRWIVLTGTSLPPERAALAGCRALVAPLLAEQMLKDRHARLATGAEPIAEGRESWGVDFTNDLPAILELIAHVTPPDQHRAGALKISRMIALELGYDPAAEGLP